ncbi:Acid phosphatase [Hyphodiscus hymeniophilus]|uniref:Purple acid phosphatase n=1 Tax=Hyphodiscus hymeniophilus TaxID=353542 RepID=A0A9P6SMS8_9HELO|nr:Acid phosphatase [Hyphodiscus hymeniophilus]
MSTIASILAILGIPFYSNTGKDPSTLTHGSINSQVRLAYAGNTGMTVSWNTFNKIAKPQVNYGFEPHFLPFYADSTVSVTYNTSLTYNNHVTLTHLLPDTVYYYLPEPLLKDNTTDVPYSFRTSKVYGDVTPYSVAVAIDMGAMGPDVLSTTAGAGQSLEAVIDSTIAGDMAYADYWLKEEIGGFLPNTTIADGYIVYESILNDFYDQMTPITTKKPYMVGPGNHEADCDAGGTPDTSKNITYTGDICMPGQSNFTGYINHFRMPSAESGGTGNFWYSWNHGMTHYIQLDTETDLGHGFIAPDAPGGQAGEDSGPFNSIMNAQTTWLQKDLAAVDRSRTPWVIVAGHRPWYLSYANVTKTVCWSCKDVFEPLFLQYGVDLCISGHAHLYQRSAQLSNGVIDPNELNNPSAPWYSRSIIFIDVSLLLFDGQLTMTPVTNGAAGHYDGLDALASLAQPYQRFGLDTSDEDVWCIEGKRDGDGGKEDSSKTTWKLVTVKM